MTLPLTDLRIIAVEQYGAGPFGTAHLADQGAEVIKIEHRASGGDMSRGVGPYFLGEHDSQFFQSLNRNKRSLTLDLKRPEGQQVLHRLAATADGLLGNLRGDQPDKLGLTYERLKLHNPAIVCVHLSAYGRDGARKSWPGYDYLMQAEAGYLSLTGEPDSPPARMGLSIVDFLTGTTAVFALVSAILAARATGQGRDIDVSLYDVAMHQLSYPAVWYLNEELKTERVARSGHPYLVPSQLYRTADGWIFIMCQHQGFWQRLCELIERPDLATDEKFIDTPARHRHREPLTEVLDEIFIQHSTREWLDKLQGTVPCGPVHDLAQALDNPFFRERGGVQPVTHSDKADLKLLNSPIRGNEPIPARPAPKLGQDNDDLLAELGYSKDEIIVLRREGVI